MKLFNLRKLTTMVAFALVALFATSTLAHAQVTNRDYKEMQKAQKRIQKSQRKYPQQQQQQGYYTQRRYRVNTNGRYYNTDERGAQVLRQAVNSGYQQGFRAGQNDAQRRNQYGYNTQNTYRSGNYGYSYVDRNQYKYYFQQGFQKGYQDGYYKRNQYGSNGTNILGSILSSILNIQQY